MQNFKINSSNFPYLFSGLFIFVSAIFILIAVFTGYSAIKTKTNCDTYTIASKVEISSHWSNSNNGSGRTMMYSPVFFYNVEGREYSCSTGSSSSSKPNIDNNKIFYNSQNPEWCISEYDLIQNSIFAGLFFIIALPQFIIGLFVLMKAIIQNSKYKKLKQYGQLIKDIPCRIIPSNITKNDRQGYIIELEYEGLKFKSETKFDIDIRRNMADLLIDPLNTKNYFIGFDITQNNKNSY